LIVLFFSSKAKKYYNYLVNAGEPEKTLRSAKHPYRRPIGYATKSLCSDICKTATNIPEAAYVDQMIEMHAMR
jgi:hypothetical protein